MPNRMNGDPGRRVRHSLDALLPLVQTWTAALRSSELDARVDAALAEARRAVSPGRAVSDDDLRRQVRPRVRRAWLEELQATYDQLRPQFERTQREFAQVMEHARSRPLPMPAPNASAPERTAFHLELLNVRMDYPSEMRLRDLWDAFVDADTQNDEMRAGWLENLIANRLTQDPAPAGDLATATSARRERESIRQQLEALRDRRLTESDRGNLAAWTAEIADLGAQLRNGNEQLIVLRRYAA